MQLKARLKSNDGERVTTDYFALPPFMDGHHPQVLIWGVRVFVFECWRYTTKGDKVLEYKEVFGYVLTEEIP